MERYALYTRQYSFIQAATDYDLFRAHDLYTNVSGSPGSLKPLEGEDFYDGMVLMATCFLSDSSQIPATAVWLKGNGTVNFANR